MLTVAGFSLREVIKFIQGCTNQLSKKGESKEEKRAHVKETKYSTMDQVKFMVDSL